MEKAKSNKRILVLDRDSRMIAAVDDILSEGGWEVSFTYDPNSVYDLAKTQQPDLVILDFLLLNNDCAMICQDFKDDPELSSVPIIVVTAYRTRKMTAIANQCDALFVKPLDVGIVASRIDYLMAS